MFFQRCLGISLSASLGTSITTLQIKHSSADFSVHLLRHLTLKNVSSLSLAFVDVKSSALKPYLSLLSQVSQFHYFWAQLYTGLARIHPLDSNNGQVQQLKISVPLQQDPPLSQSFTWLQQKPLANPKGEDMDMQPSLSPISFIFMQFSAQNLLNKRLAHPLAQSWIRYCKLSVMPSYCEVTESTTHKHK